MWRTMFSIITMASSTTKPTEMVSASSEKLSSAKPTNHIAASVPAIDSGTVTPAATVGTSRRMNSATTSSTSATEISRLICTSSTLARMVWVRSDRMVSLMSGGIQDLQQRQHALMRSTVSMTLAPTVLVTVSRIAGLLAEPGGEAGVGDAVDRRWRRRPAARWRRSPISAPGGR